MALDVESVVDGGMRREEFLRAASALETSHLALPPSGRLMRILGPIVAASERKNMGSWGSANFGGLNSSGARAFASRRTKCAAPQVSKLFGFYQSAPGKAG